MVGRKSTENEIRDGSDCQIPLACDMFVELKGREILKKNLYRNFVLHMCSLFDYGLVAPDSFYKTMQKLQKILSDYHDGKQMLTEARREHLTYWNKFGVQRHIQLQMLPKEERKVADGGGGKDTKDKDSFPKPKTECRGVAIKSASNVTVSQKRKVAAGSRANGHEDSGKRKFSERGMDFFLLLLFLLTDWILFLEDEPASPPRRRSSGSTWTTAGGAEKRARMELNRRKSLGGTNTSKTRLSVSLTKVDRELGSRK
uniref:Polycomb protein VEFS-Box domain-containing protein n=1 Tax=Phlebotomus papatasi TaxID=29031 RepID=A0A1B0D8P8_PHLPP